MHRCINAQADYTGHVISGPNNTIFVHVAEMWTALALGFSFTCAHDRKVCTYMFFARAPQKRVVRRDSMLALCSFTYIHVYTHMLECKQMIRRKKKGETGTLYRYCAQRNFTTMANLTCATPRYASCPLCPPQFRVLPTWYELCQLKQIMISFLVPAQRKKTRKKTAGNEETSKVTHHKYLRTYTRCCHYVAFCVH